LICLWPAQLIKDFVEGFADRISLELSHAIPENEDVPAKASIWLFPKGFQERLVV
jgi:hypothetical protein